MRTLVLAPHHDDETLFAAFLVQRHSADIIVCFRPVMEHERYGQPEKERIHEFHLACDHLRAGNVRTLGLSNDSQDDMLVRDLPTHIRDAAHALHPHGYGRVYAPAHEIGGHPQHGIVASAAVHVFGPAHVEHYTTYTRHGGRTTTDRQVDFDARMVSRKLRAMSAYRSQIEHASTRGWFVDHPPIREYLA